METFCIIPARGGSKRIPNKNLYTINGKPLIAYAIEAALKSQIFGSVLVTTDSNEIADVAKKFGAEVPKLRTSELSNDYIGTHPVIQDAITKLNFNNINETVIMCLYPTAVLITPWQIKLGYEKFLGGFNRYPLLTLCRYSHPIERSFKTHNGAFWPVSPDKILERTQDLEIRWFDAGQFYIAMALDWISKKTFTGPFNAIELTSEEFTDIDTYEDINIVKRKLAYRST